MGSAFVNIMRVSIMTSLWISLALTKAGALAAFNPMELYIDSEEGVSFAFEIDGVKQYSYIVRYDYYDRTWSSGADYKSLGFQTDSGLAGYTRMRVVERIADSDDFMIQYNYSLWCEEDQGIHEGEPLRMTVQQNDDGTVALRCHYNGLYATWSNTFSPPSPFYDSDLDGDGLADEAEIFESVMGFICTESGICPTCRFSLETGSITDISIRLVALFWGDPEEAIPSSPSTVMEDNVNNYSETETQTTLRVSYTQTTSDTTIWEHTWGFELSMSSEISVDIPTIGSTSRTTTATASYNGKYGTESTVTNSSTVEDSKTVNCPPMTRCSLKLVATKLNDYSIPFTALVQRSQDVGPPLQMQESGVWRGVQAFDFETIYCTTDLSTDETNCPEIDGVK